MVLFVSHSASVGLSLFLYSITVPPGNLEILKGSGKYSKNGGPSCPSLLLFMEKSRGGLGVGSYHLNRGPSSVL